MNVEGASVLQDATLSPEVVRKRRRRKYLLGATGAVAVVAALTAVWLWSPSGASVSANDILTGTAQAGTFVVRLSAAGVLKPTEERWVTSLVSGTVQAVDVEAGARVKAGQVLAQLTNPDLNAAELQARSNLASMRADRATTEVTLNSELLALEADLASARSTAETAQLRAQVDGKLYREHIIGQLRYKTDQLAAADDLSKVDFIQKKIALFRNEIPSLDSAKLAEVAAAEAALSKAKQDIDALSVRADVAGTVETLPIRAGQHVQAGGSLARIATLNHLKAVINVTPDAASQIAPGQPAQISYYGSVKETVDGVVARVSPTVVKGVVPVTVQLEGALPKGARPELAVLGDITVSAIPHAVYVDRPVNVEPDSAGYVYRLTDRGTAAVRVPVHFGAASSSEIQVLSGLRPGDRIVTSETRSFDAKSRIEID